MGRFPLVHPLGAALINHALRVTNDAILVLRTHRFQKLYAGNPSSPSAVQYDFNIFDIFAAQMERIDQSCRTDHRGTMLIIVEDRYVHFLFEALFDHKTFRRFDVL